MADYIGLDGRTIPLQDGCCLRCSAGDHSLHDHIGCRQCRCKVSLWTLQESLNPKIYCEEQSLAPENNDD